MDQNLSPEAVTLTKTLAAHLAAARFADLSPAAQHAARRGVLDWIGCALAACRHPEIDILSANMINFGGSWSGRPFKPVGGPITEIPLLELLANEESICIATTIRRSVFDRIGGFDESLRTNEDYDFWLRAACAGCRICFNPKPLAYYRRRSGSVSADEAAMLAGIVAVLLKTRPRLAGRMREVNMLDAQVRRFRRRRSLVLATAALEQGDFSGAADHLWSLYQISGRYFDYGVARLATWAPRLLRQGYSVKKMWRSLRTLDAPAAASVPP